MLLICVMQNLNFKPYPIRLKKVDETIYIYDIIRKKFLINTPEEWVRQHVLHYLMQELNYPISLINVEKLLLINGIKKRYDIVVFNRDGSIKILVECKAPEVKIDQKTFDQIARYNLTLNAQYLMVTNGLNHYFCTMDFEKMQYHFLQNLPVYTIL